MLQAYNFAKETVTALMMFYQNTKSVACSSDADTKFFDIDAIILEEDALAPYVFIISLDYA